MSELQSRINQIIEDVLSTRFDFVIPRFDASVAVLEGATLDLTERLTKLESLLSQAIRAKAALDRSTTLLRLEYQAKWDSAISGRGKRPTFNDYASGKEKAAEANLATFEEQKKLNAVEQDLAFANEAVDIARLHYYGLDKIRQDVRKRLDSIMSDHYSIS